mgnify:CR=1 FL=1|jgi:arylsulfatase A-like enzyme|tara:strand:+ start:233 stop:550 length:318 start_codon:yes stop_codon:yes gene_type:complete
MKATLLLLVFLSLMGRTTCVAEDQPASPNININIIDDLGFADLSCTGNTKVKTPHLEKLAAEGTLFKQFYVASPICSPLRVGVTTGHYPARHLIKLIARNFLFQP